MHGKHVALKCLAFCDDAERELNEVDQTVMHK